MEVYKAIWDFSGTDSDQLSFRKGDLITLLGKDSSGWWLGEIRRRDGKLDDGLFPENYTELYSNTKMDYTKSSGSIGTSHGDVKSQGSAEVLILDAKDGALNSKKMRKHKQMPVARTVFRVWAHTMAKYGGAASLIVFGLLAMHFGAAEKAEGAGIIDVALGVLAVGAGSLMLLYESVFEGEPILDMFPLRAMLWIFLAAICFVSFPLWTAGLYLIVAALADAIGFLKAEQYIPPKKRRKTQKDKEIAEEDSQLSYSEKLWSWIVHKHEENKLQRLIFCVIYFVLNVILFVYTAIIWTEIVNMQNADDRLSGWAPIAKAFGALIDLNSSLLLIPVCRTIIRFMYNKATADESCSARSLRVFFAFIPLDKAILLHKQLAKISLFAVIGHTIAHFINYNLRPDQTLALFGIWPFYSGVMLLVFCLLIYSGAVEEVKHPTFEIFWYSHHIFFFYFAITITHGAGGFNPNFWKFFIIPGVLYVIERILRVLRGRRHVSVHNVLTMEPNLLAFEMDKKSAFGEAGFREGQYVFVNCPSVKPYEWHPFTISSPPQKDTFSLHIQTQGSGSWTEGVKDYLTSMGPKNRTFFKLQHRNNQGKLVPGKTIGPNGLQILLIDGPHSAPTQHMTEYEIAMIAGAGIGLTPVIACAESIVYHRWKFGIGKVFPSHAYFSWVVSHRDVEAYRWFIVKVIECQAAVINMRKKSDIMKDKTFKAEHHIHSSFHKTFHHFDIYVTSVPKNVTKKYADEALELEHEQDFWGRGSTDVKVVQEKANVGKRQLYTYMLHPTEKVKEFDDITVTVGRPQWNGPFNDVATKHPSTDVGVMFCGNRYIGKDLKKMCARYSSVERKQFFRLHKENF